VGKVVGELVKGLARSMPVAVVRADGALARGTAVAGFARALSRAAITRAATRALNLGRDMVVVASGRSSPGTGGGAGACDEGERGYWRRAGGKRWWSRTGEGGRGERESA
jgi:hypothetical protein